MAKIYSMPNAAEWEKKEGESWDEYMKRESAMFDALQTTSDALPKGELKGLLISTPHADSAAYYVVHSVKPLALLHVPFCDKWRNTYFERSITVTEIKRMQKSQAEISAMFAKRKAA